MRKIVGIVRPFDMNQTFMVYEDGNKLDVVETTLENLNNTILGLADKYSVDNVNLIGPQKFLHGISNKLKEEFSLKYDNRNLTVDIN